MWRTNGSSCGVGGATAQGLSAGKRAGRTTGVQSGVDSGVCPRARVRTRRGAIALSTLAVAAWPVDGSNRCERSCYRRARRWRDSSGKLKTRRLSMRRNGWGGQT